MIAFIGSVFSPYYAWRGRRDPMDHCAVNIALYGPASRWAMTERGKSDILRGQSLLRIGPSALRWENGTLLIELDEISAPIPRRIRGTIRLSPQASPSRSFALDSEGKHVWQPIAPLSRIEVKLDKPELRWEGAAYLDSNFGCEPLETGFRNWSWSRAHRSKDCIVLYDTRRRDGSSSEMALRFTGDGGVEAIASPPQAALASTGWGIARPARADAGHAVTLLQTLENAPFYARSRLATQLHGERGDVFHESLDLDRFKNPVVRAMLPFRMPRRIF